MTVGASACRPPRASRARRRGREKETAAFSRRRAAALGSRRNRRVGREKKKTPRDRRFCRRRDSKRSRRSLVRAFVRGRRRASPRRGSARAPRRSPPARVPSRARARSAHTPRAWTTTRARSNAMRDKRVRDETLRRWSGKRTMTRFFFVGGRVGILRGSRRSLRRRSPATTRSRSTGRRTPGGAACSLSRARRREGRSRAPSPRCRPRRRCSSSSKGSARSGRGGNASPRGVVCSDDLASPTRRDGEGFCFRDETRSPWE